MDPWAIMNTQEIWAQPTPSQSSTFVTNVTTAMASRRVDTCVTAGSNPKPSPPLLLLPSSPPLPSTDGPYAWRSANPRRPKTTVSTTETGRSEGKGEVKRHIGVSDKLRQPERGKPPTVVEKRSEWYPNHLSDPERPQPPPPIPANASKTTRFALLGGNHHLLPPVPDGTIAGPPALPIWSNATIARMKTGEKEEEDEEKRQYGVLTETERRGEKPHTVVGKQGEWLENHSFDPGKPPPFHPNPAFSSKITRSAFPGGSRHPFIPSGPSGTYAGPTTPPTRSDVTETPTRRSRKVDIDGGRRLRGVLDETKRLGQPKPQFAVVEGGKWLENHSPTDETPQGSPPPSQVSKTTRFASSSGNHPLPPTPTRPTCIDAYLRVENPSGSPQSLTDTTRTVKRGYKQPPSSPIPSPSHTMRTDAYLRVGNLPEPLEATRATEQGYKPTQPPSTSSPSCTTRTDVSRHVVDVFNTTSGPIGQTPTRSTRSTHRPSLITSAMPPSSCTARLDVSKRVENSLQPSVTESSHISTRLFHSSSPSVTPDTSKRVENPDRSSQAPSPSLTTKTTLLASFGGNDHHLTPSLSTSTPQDAHLRVLDTIQALPAIPRRVSTCGSPLPPSTTYTTCFNASLRVENPCGAPQLPSDTIRTCKRGILPHCSPFNGSASCLTQTEAPFTVADPSGHLLPTPVSRMLRIGSLIASLGDNHPPSMLESWKAAVLSPTQDEVYEGVGEPTIFPPMRTTRTRLPARCRNTPMGLLPTYSPVPSSQTAIVNTSTCVSPLASQDAQIKLSSSVVTDVSVDTQALVGDVSLVNEINSVSNPIWVKCAATKLLVAGATLSSSELSLGVKDSHSHHQDFSQEPDEYNFDPDPGTNSNNFGLKFQGNLPFCFILLCGSIGPKYHCDPYTGFVLPANSGE